MDREIYPFTDPKQEALFQKLIHALRCITCQNRSLADSEAEIAFRLRQEIYTQIRSNKTEMEIIASMTAKYGQDISYHPPFNSSTLVLWLGPLCLLLCGVWIFRNCVKFNFKSTLMRRIT